MDTAKDFIAKWSQPAVVITLASAIAYGIIWGVQLNSAVLGQATLSATLAQELLHLRREHSSAAIITAQTVEALSQVTKNQDRLLTRMTRNEGWISDNRDRINKAEQ